MLAYAALEGVDDRILSLCDLQGRTYPLAPDYLETLGVWAHHHPDFLYPTFQSIVPMNIISCRSKVIARLEGGVPFDPGFAFFGLNGLISNHPTGFVGEIGEIIVCPSL